MGRTAEHAPSSTLISCSNKQLFSIPKCLSLFWKHRFYTGNQNRETPGDSKHVFLQCVDVLARCWLPQAAAPVYMQALVRFGVKLRSGLLSISVHSYGHGRGLGYNWVLQMHSHAWV